MMNALKRIGMFCLLALLLSACAVPDNQASTRWSVKTPRPSAEDKTQKPTRTPRPSPTPRPTKEPPSAPLSPDEYSGETVIVPTEDEDWLEHWVDENIDKVHRLKIADGLEINGTVKQAGEVWYAVKPEQSAVYTMPILPDVLHDHADVGVRVYDSDMWPVTPNEGTGGFTLYEDQVYYLQADFERVDSPQAYTLCVTAKIEGLPEHWNYYGDLFEETPGYWLALSPNTGGRYTVEFEQEENDVSFTIWEKAKSLKRLRPNANDEVTLEFGKVYYIEVKSKIKSFYGLEYIVTIQLLDDEDEEFPDDKDYNYDP